MRNIRASVFTQMLGMLGQVGIGFKRMVQNGVKISMVTEGEEGVYETVLKFSGGAVFNLSYKFTDIHHKRCNITLTDPENEEKTFTAKGVIPAKIDAAIYKLIETGWNIPKSDLRKNIDDADDSDVDTMDDAVEDTEVDGEGTETVASRSLSVTLQRVCGTTEDRIDLVKVYGNYATTDMENDIVSILDDPEVSSQITECPTTLKITDCGDSYEVCPDTMVEHDCICASIHHLLKCAHTVLHNLQFIHWNARGADFLDIHQATDSSIWCVRHHIDALAELCVEHCGSVAHPRELVNVEYDTKLFAENIDLTLEGIQSNLHTLIHCIEFYTPNFSADVQGMFNQWVRELRHEADFILKQQVSPASILV